ncbi:putative tail fiber protein [Escherichia phage phiEcoM-GJ1]|uniref:Putative tail fiber protein n=1 Tax=Escherichia phage phiEcoM-GJ1 TaxID=451705 RepID=A9Q1X5_9CAUD|nr:putative tail fiber protein [Escherichia phage phiEcoM-GJ1]ABR68784.1 putative tail fiber protein [Escherichia phage phiEcoM-GJ1]
MAKGYSLDALVNEHYIKSRTGLGNISIDTITGMDSVGVYYQSRNDYATLANKYPPGANAGTLEVLPHNANVGRVMQRYTNFSNKRMWVRSQNGTVSDANFDEWTEFVNMNNIYNAIYPIGIVVKFDNATNPNNNFTGTVWEQIIDGRVARAATGPEAGTADGQIGSIAGSDTANIAVTNLPGHTHGMQNHTHGIASHSHTMAHTHTINHDHGAVTSSSSGAHTHSVSGTAASAGAHQHTEGSPFTGDVNFGTTTSTSKDNISDWLYSPSTRYPLTSSSGAHTHSVSGTAASAGAHTHSVDLPNFTGTSGGSSTGNTGGTALTTGGPSNNTTTSTGDGTAFDVRNASHYYAFWKRVA